MDDKFLYDEVNNYIKYGKEEVEIPNIINTGLSSKIKLREYQKEALRNFIYYYNNKKLRKNKQVHTLFHMATGSGKTVIMASLILYLYTKGYKKIVFFVNQTNILEKTKDNFMNSSSTKYLFSDELKYLGSNINITPVSNFSNSVIDDNIEIVFTTTQKLHKDILEPKENSLTSNDFEDNDIVFISDESHHINSSTKRESKEEEKDRKSWEYSVMKALNSNFNNVMLEFTATADLNDYNVNAKYKDKIIYDYPLIKFRKSGFTKDFKNFATESSVWNRTLMALIVSEYRKFLFTELKQNKKPVVLLKSQYVPESESFYEEFFKKINEIKSSDILDLYSPGNDFFNKILDYFKAKDNTFNLLIDRLIKSFSKENSILINGSMDEKIKKELLLSLNSLEDNNNKIRLVFAVDMLNEGWDVLNLFDIVRLYDTRQGGKGNKPGPYTIKEAQLIGRGARYCPFVSGDIEEKFVRKYDDDLDNRYRILETMFFHSKNDSKYISELKQALIATGLQDENPIEIEYKVKEEFKKSKFYKTGFILSNKRVEKNRQSVKYIDGKLKYKTHNYIVSNNKVQIYGLFDNDNNVVNQDKKIKSYLFKDIPYNILLGASEKYNELKFNVIKEKYPSLTSMRDFLLGDDYLGNNQIDMHYVEEIKGKDLFNACIFALSSIAKHILSIKPEYIGTKEFYPSSVSSVIKDKKIYTTKIDGNGGKGDSQNNCKNENYIVDLTKESWYVFNDNFGTSEEKLFIKYFKTNLKPKLDDKGLEYYVIRNERIPDLAIFSFDNGERFEPDFILFVRKNELDRYSNSQIYIEPKGDFLLKEDKWKEEFLDSIEDNFETNNLLTSDYNIIGMPFFNEKIKKEEFIKSINDFIDKL